MIETGSHKSEKYTPEHGDSYQMSTWAIAVTGKQEALRLPHSARKPARSVPRLAMLSKKATGAQSNPQSNPHASRERSAEILPHVNGEETQKHTRRAILALERDWESGNDLPSSPHYFFLYFSHIAMKIKNHNRMNQDE